MVDSDSNIGVWVIDDAPSAACVERLGDARRLANTMGTRVAVLLAGCEADGRQDLIHHGADLVLYFVSPADMGTKVRTTAETIKAFGPRVVFAGGNAPAREWAALVAARRAQPASPAAGIGCGKRFRPNHRSVSCAVPEPESEAQPTCEAVRRSTCERSAEAKRSVGTERSGEP